MHATPKHAPTPGPTADAEQRSPPTLVRPVARIALVGSPNVGKSVLFNALTGRYVTVSNYPGTTVEVSRGRTRLGEEEVEIVDTPGMYGLLPISDEERVARRILLDERPEAVVHVVDAKNLERMLPLSLQLAGLGRPLVVVLNMMDEAEALHMSIDFEALERWLGVPVVPAVATTGRGLDVLRRVLQELRERPGASPSAVEPHEDDVEAALDEIVGTLEADAGAEARTLALLGLQGDAEILARLEAHSPEAVRVAEAARARLTAAAGDPAYRVVYRLHDHARAFVFDHVRSAKGDVRTFAEHLGDLLVKPLVGVPVLLLVLYFGLYQFVGVFGAGTVVDFLESHVFGVYVNPRVESVLQSLLPGESGVSYWTRELIGGDYGVITLGLTYAFAIVLPIVALFFIFFSVLEDTGYFPRLAMLVDRLFKRIGLNGRAVIPVVLGFACDTMATMVTRIQETKRERVITTFLLALAIPCSAQYGVIAALLAAQPGQVLGMSYAFLAWMGLVAAIFFVGGWAASRVVTGPAASFYMELPPLRLPRMGNVISKTLARMKWYFAEVLPFFILASVLIWVGRLTGLFGLLIAGLEPVVRLLGLPAKAAEIFLYGFFRRDFGAAGLYDLDQAGSLSTGQLLVAGVTLTLFIPCVAQLLVMYKERGLRQTTVIVGVVMTLAFVVGGLTHLVLRLLGVMA